MGFDLSPDGKMTKAATYDEKEQIIEAVVQSFERITEKAYKPGNETREAIVQNIETIFEKVKINRAYIGRIKENEEIKAVIACEFAREGNKKYAELLLLNTRKARQGFGKILETEAEVCWPRYFRVTELRVKENSYAHAFFDRMGFEPMPHKKGWMHKEIG